MTGLRTADLVASGGFGGLRPVAWAATGRPGGSGRHGGLNLAGHVGDDPARVAANREALARWARVDAVLVLDAVHGSRVGTTDLAGCDGAVCAEPGTALVALAADCATAALADPDAGVIGVLHCGWRGLVGSAGGDVVSNTVERMLELGARHLRAVLGPAICGPCYRVDAARAAQVSAAVPDAVERSAGGDWHVDVRAGVRARLRSLGVRHVMEAGGCTMESPNLYSFRGAGGAATGRQGLLVRSW